VITFIAVPAPTTEEGQVDIIVVNNVLENLHKIKYKGIVVIKSTIPPCELSALVKKFTNLEIVYSPEFLREKMWTYDVHNPCQIILAGKKEVCEDLIEIYKRHASISRTRFVITDIQSASLAKYTINTFLATKVVFMNQIQQLYVDIHGSSDGWDEFCKILDNDMRIGHTHMQVPGSDGQYGYGGTCFPKDVKAIIGFDKNQRTTLIRETELANTKLRLQGGID
jgi:UDPglucose 6-dehydrogenase